VTIGRTAASRGDATLAAGPVRRAFAGHPDLAGFTGAVTKVTRLGGLSNEVYRLHGEAGRFVLRLPRPGRPALVDRAAELANLRLAASLGLAPDPLYADADEGVLLLPDLEGKTGTPAPEALGMVLARLHAADFRFENRREPIHWIAGLLARVGDQPGRTDLAVRAEALAGKLTREASGQASGETAPFVPSHWDIIPDNCLLAEGGPVLLDWEYSAMGPPAWDLAYAALELGYGALQERRFLEAYLTAGGAAVAAADVQAMKVTCDLVSALWALTQEKDPDAASSMQLFARERLDRAEQSAGLIAQA